VPELYDVPSIRKEFGDSMKPTQVVLVQEIERYNKLISDMSSSLFNLLRALKGEIGMSSDLD